MDFSRTAQQPTAAPAHSGAPAPAAGKKRSNNDGSMSRWLNFALGAAFAALIVALVVVISVGGDKPENKYVDGSRLQAVFLNTGQVYFGKVKAMNDKYFVLTNIYYLQTQSSGTGTAAAASTQVSLVKLGCELHEPLDQMLINRTQVTFWENLDDRGQVAQAVKTFQDKNPKGQSCTSTANSTSDVQNANNGSGTINSTTGTGTTKP